MISRKIFPITFSGPKTKLFGLHFPGMEIAVMWVFLNIRHLPQYHWPFKDDREGSHSQNLMTSRCILSGPVNFSNWVQYSSPHLWKQLPNRALSALMGFNYFEDSLMGPSPTHQWHGTKIFLKCRPKGRSPFLSYDATVECFSNPVLSWAISWISWLDLGSGFLPWLCLTPWDGTWCSLCSGAVGPCPDGKFTACALGTNVSPSPVESPSLAPSWHAPTEQVSRIRERGEQLAALSGVI